MKKRNTLLAAIMAVSMLAAVGCGNLEDVEPEKDGANLLETTAHDDHQPPEDNEGGDDENDQQNESDGEETYPDEQLPDPDEDTESEESDESTAEEDSAADGESDGGDTATPPTEGDSYYNPEFAFTVPLPQSLKWTLYDEQMMPCFDDSNGKFRPLMQTENEGDVVLTIEEYQTLRTLDDIVKAAWDRDYRNAGEGDDKYEVLDTQVLDFGGRAGQLVTEKLNSSNGEFFYCNLYITVADGDYIHMKVTCLDQTQHDSFVASLMNTTFDN